MQMHGACLECSCLSIVVLLLVSLSVKDNPLQFADVMASIMAESSPEKQ